MNRLLSTIVLLTYLFFPSGAFAEDDKSKPIPNYTIQIASPLNGQTFQNDVDSFSVTVNVTPALEKEDSVAVIVDGTQSADTSHSTTIMVPRLERGSHTLQAKVIQPKGKGAISSTITIYQQRTSKLLSH